MKTKNGKTEYGGDHWGLVVLDEHSATLRLYNASYNAWGSEPIMSDTSQMANSISSQYELT